MIVSRGPLLLAFGLLLARSGAQSTDSTMGDGHVHAAFKVLLNIDARNTVVFDRTVKFFGIRLGAQKNKDILAVGLYGLDNPLVDHEVEVQDVGRNKVDLRTSLSYAGLTYERVFIDNERWQLSAPLLVGLGNTKVDFLDSLGTYKPFAEREVVPLELGVRGAYKLFFWMYVHAGVGYREVMSTDARVKKNYSGFTWSYGLSLKLGNIYRYARDKVKAGRANKAAGDGTK